MISAMKKLIFASCTILFLMQSSVAGALMEVIVTQLEGKRWQVRFDSASPVSKLYFIANTLDEPSARTNLLGTC